MTETQAAIGQIIIDVLTLGIIALAYVALKPEINELAHWIIGRAKGK